MITTTIFPEYILQQVSKSLTDPPSIQLSDDDVRLAFAASVIGILILCIAVIINQGCVADQTPKKQTQQDNIMQNYMYDANEEENSESSENDSDSDTDSFMSEPDYDFREEDVPNDIGDRMKFYETKTAESILSVPPYFPFIIRLDGRAFSGLFSTLNTWEWRNNKQPYSDSFHNAMMETAKDLLYEFSPSTVYTHSDEITLIFPELCTYEEYSRGVRDDGRNISRHIFDGRLFKLLSIIPSFTSTRFTYHLERELKSNVECYRRFFGSTDESGTMESKSKRDGPVFSFDARPIVFPLSKTFEIANHMIWRSKLDCFRNFVGMYARRMIPSKTLNGLSNVERIQKLKEMGIDLDGPTMNPVIPLMKNGAYVKKKTYDPNHDDDIMFRRRAIVFIMPNIRCDEKHIDILLSKHITTEMLQ
jgi:tRNA(His) 5'-end guanylyltransferase